MFTGCYAVNPVNGEQIPVWIADYVLMGYGSGAIMAVPCGDQRDFEFAGKFGLPIPPSRCHPPSGSPTRASSRRSTPRRGRCAYVGDAPYVSSSNARLDLNGIDNKAEGVGDDERVARGARRRRGTINYKLRDWLFSRQRYWGEPFPIVYDVDGRPHALPDEMLPVALPETDSFSPRTFDPDDEFSNPESPLDRLTDWVEVELDLGDGPQIYRRDGNVMPQWAGSCWYELRYLDPTNENGSSTRDVERYWTGPRTDVRPDHPGGVDLYVGGVEHAVLHLLYARFWHKVLYDLGQCRRRSRTPGCSTRATSRQPPTRTSARSTSTPSRSRERDGRYFFEGEPVTREWGKMGKSLKNAVSPDEMYEQYGADTLRLYEMASGPLDASRPWETRDVVGMYRFLQRLWRNDGRRGDRAVIVVDAPADDETRRAAAPDDRHRAHRDGSTPVQHRDRQADRAQQPRDQARCHAREVAEPMVLMVAPLVPHIAEELWRKLGHDETVTYLDFPVADPAFLVDDTIELPVQINGKVRGRITVPPTPLPRSSSRRRWGTTRSSPPWQVRPRRRSSS